MEFTVLSFDWTFMTRPRLVKNRGVFGSTFRCLEKIIKFDLLRVKVKLSLIQTQGDENSIELKLTPRSAVPAHDQTLVRVVEERPEIERWWLDPGMNVIHFIVVAVELAMLGHDDWRTVNTPSFSLKWVLVALLFCTVHTIYYYPPLCTIRSQEDHHTIYRGATTMSSWQQTRWYHK